MYPSASQPPALFALPARKQLQEVQLRAEAKQHAVELLVLYGTHIAMHMRETSCCVQSQNFRHTLQIPKVHVGLPANAELYTYSC